MAATLSRIIFDQAGNIQMIVHPDRDAQLSDPAFGPAGAVWADIARTAYQSCESRRDLLALAGPVIAAKNVTAGLAIAAQIQAMDMASETDTALDT